VGQGTAEERDELVLSLSDTCDRQPRHRNWVSELEIPPDTLQLLRYNMGASFCQVRGRDSLNQV